MAVENEALDPGFLSDFDVDANVRKVVRTLLVVKDMTLDDLADAIPMSRSTLYTRLAVKGKRSRFTAAEVYRMARVFDVKVGTFYAPPELSALGYKPDDAGEPPDLKVLDGQGKGPGRGLPIFARSV